MNLLFPSLEIARPFAAPIGLDFEHLIATCAALQAATPTASTEAQLATARELSIQANEALVRLIEGRPGWAAAVAVMQGSFHPDAVRYVSDNIL